MDAHTHEVRLAQWKEIILQCQVNGVKRNVKERSDLLRGVTGIGEFADGAELLLIGFEKVQELFMADVLHSHTGSRVRRRRLVMGIRHEVFQIEVSAGGVVHLSVPGAPSFLVGFPAGWLTAEDRSAALSCDHALAAAFLTLVLRFVSSDERVIVLVPNGNHVGKTAGAAYLPRSYEFRNERHGDGSFVL